MKTLTLFILCLSLTSGETVRQLFEDGSYQQETLGDYKAALTHYDRAIEVNHPSEDLMVKIYVRAIQCAIELGDQEKAASLYNDLEKKYGDNKTEEKARLAFSKQLDTNLAFVGELLTMDTKAKELDVQKSEKLRTEGWVMFGKRNFAEGKSLFRQALQANPSNNDAWNGLGWCFFNLKRSDVAKTAFEKALELNPENPGALNGLAWIAKNAGDTKEAIAKWNQCIDASPMATAAYSGLVSTYFTEKDYDNAARYASLWVDADPTSAQAGTALKNAIAKGGKVPEQTKAFDFLEPAPWGDFEQSLYRITDMSGKTIGSSVYTITGNENVWLFDDRFCMPNLGMTIYLGAECDRETFHPKTCSARNMLGDIHYTYKTSAGKTEIQVHGKNQANVTKLAKPSLDNGQVLSAIRRLPLQEGFSTSVDVCSPQMGVCNAKLTVKPKVTVKVPAGSIVCYPILMEAFLHKRKLQTADIWIEKAAPHRIIKTDFRTYKTVLISSSTNPDEKYDHYFDDKLKTNIQVPEGWYVGRHSGSNYKQEISLLSPEMKAQAYLLTADNKKRSAEKVFARDYKTLQDYFTDYTLRKESKTTKKHGNYTAISYAADYKSGENELVEHRCYYVKDSMVHWLIFRCAKEDYPDVKVDIETIIEQFKAE